MKPIKTANNPTTGAEIVRIFEPSAIDGTAVYPVEINGEMVEFFRDESDRWTPVDPGVTLPPIVCWCVGDLIESIQH